MKIQIQSNTSMLKSFLDSDISFGYHYGYENHQSQNNNNSFFFKVFSHLEKIFFKSEISNEQVDFAKSIIDTLTKYEKIINNPDLINNLKVQLNFPTAFHEFLTKNLYLTLFPTEYHDSFKSNSDLNAAEIISTENVVLLGSNCFFTDGFCTNLKNHIGIKRASSLILLHEIAHGLDVKLNSFKPKLKIENESAYSKFFEQIFVTRREIYADVGSILLQRNIDIQEGVYSKEQTASDLNSLIFNRNKCLPIINNNDFNSFLYHLTHFSVPGLKHLKQQLEQYKDKPLSIDEINQLAKDCIDYGIAKLMVVTASAENFSNIFKNFNSVHAIVSDFGIDDKIDQKWLDNHKKTFDFLNTNKEKIPYPLNELIWNYEFNHIEYNRISAEIKNSHKIELPPVYKSEEDKKLNIMDKIDSMRSSISRTNNTNCIVQGP